MRKVRELTAAMGALAVALALVLTGAPTAVAGGPTSVMLASPTSWQTASLYNNDEKYERLGDLLGHAGGDLDHSTEEKPPKLGDSIGHQINVTWLAHDVSPWRVDRVFPSAPGTKSVWILTELGMSEPRNETWHEAQDPAALRALLTDLGVMGKKPTATDTASGATQPSEDASAAASAGTEEPPARTASAATADGTDWWWAIPGAAAGAVLALVLRPFVPGVPRRLSPVPWPPRRRRVREPGPRQELTDV